MVLEYTHVRAYHVQKYKNQPGTLPSSIQASPQEEADTFQHVSRGFLET